ncbi:MAG: hypothetical protein AB1782_11305 [Cyanobacteriota bacterium]
MLKHSKLLAFLLAAILIFTGVSMVSAKPKNCCKKNFNCIETKKPFKVDNYEEAVSYYMNFKYESDDIFKKVSELKELFDKMNIIEIDSFSSNEKNGYIRGKVIKATTKEIYSILSQQPQLVSYNISQSRCGNNYNFYLEQYHTYKALIDNFDQIEKIITCNYEYDISPDKIKNLLLTQLNNNEANMNSCDNKINSINIEITVTPPPDKEKQ